MAATGRCGLVSNGALCECGGGPREPICSHLERPGALPRGLPKAGILGIFSPPSHSDGEDSVEGSVMDGAGYEEAEREVLSWGWLTSRELTVIKAIYVSEAPIREELRRVGLPSDDALRQLLSRARRKAAARRDNKIGGL